MLWLLPLLFTLATDPAPRAASPSPREDATRLLADPDRRVRSSEPKLVNLIDEGVRRSHTFARLIQMVHESDVIVYVEGGRELPGLVDGGLLLLPRPVGTRYLRILVRQDLHRDEVIALIAHELRHAIEVGEATDVRTREAFVNLYQKIGFSAPGSHRFDTQAAQDAGRTVRRELGG